MIMRNRSMEHKINRRRLVRYYPSIDAYQVCLCKYIVLRLLKITNPSIVFSSH